MPAPQGQACRGSYPRRRSCIGYRTLTSHEFPALLVKQVLAILVGGSSLHVANAECYHCCKQRRRADSIPSIPRRALCRGFGNTELSSLLHHLLSEGPFSFLWPHCQGEAGQDGGSVTFRFWKSVSVSPLPGGEGTVGCPEAWQRRTACPVCTQAGRTLGTRLL